MSDPYPLQTAAVTLARAHENLRALYRERQELRQRASALDEQINKHRAEVESAEKALIAVAVTNPAIETFDLEPTT